MKQNYSPNPLYFIVPFFLLAILVACAPIQAAMDHGDMDHSDMDHGEMDHGEMDHGSMNGEVKTSGAMVMHGDLHIQGIWGRPGFEGGTSAAYFTINNGGATMDELVGLSAEIAEATELHEVQTKDNVMSMRPVEGGLPLPTGEEVALEPGGYHVMLIGLTQDLAVGTTYPLTLQFANGGETAVDVEILEP